jgi:hypothetical protein
MSRRRLWKQTVFFLTHPVLPASEMVPMPRTFSDRTPFRRVPLWRRLLSWLTGGAVGTAQAQWWDLCAAWCEQKGWGHPDDLPPDRVTALYETWRTWEQPSAPPFSRVRPRPKDDDHRDRATWLAAGGVLLLSAPGAAQECAYPFLGVTPPVITRTAAQELAGAAAVQAIAPMLRAGAAAQHG